MISIEFTVISENDITFTVGEGIAFTVADAAKEIVFELNQTGPQGEKGDTGDGASAAVNVSYDNAGSGMVATELQAAVDEISNDFVRELELSTTGGILINGGNW